MKWQAYEELVKDVYQELGKAAGVKIECWGPSCKIRGKSGEYHQIDVLTSHDDGIHTYRTAIECKHWNTKVSKAQVLEFAGKLDDGNIEKGVLVSSSGFTRNATTIAKTKNMSLVQLRESDASDWGGFVKVVFGELNYIVDEVYDYRVILQNTERTGDDAQKGTIEEMSIKLSDNVILPVREIAERIRNYPKSGEHDITKFGFSWVGTSLPSDDGLSYVVTFRDGTSLRYTGLGYEPRVKTLSFKVRQRVFSANIHVDHQDFVSWIMKAVFKDKVFAVSPDRMPTQWR